MRTRLLELKKGLIHTQKPALSIGAQDLCGTLISNRKVTMDVQVVSTNGVPMHLFFYSMNPRVHASQGLSIGRTGKFTVTIDTTGLNVFDQIKGEIYILYNGGEQKLPYHFVIGFPNANLPEKPFKSMDDFASFARSNFEDARKIFSWNDFLAFPFMKNLHNYGLYHLYYSNVQSDAGLTEFLKAAGYSMPKAVLDAPREVLPAVEKKNTYDFSVEWNAARRNAEIMRLFLEYDACLRGNGREKAPVIRSIKRLYEANKLVPVATLLYVYVCVNERAFAKANAAMDLIQDIVQKERFEKKDQYVLFVFLQGCLEENDTKIQTAKKLAQRYYIDGFITPLLLYLEYRFNIVEKDETERKIFLENVIRRMCDSPLFIQEFAILYKECFVNIEKLTDLELRIAIYGVRNGILAEKKLFEFLAHDLKSPRSLNLYMHLLRLSYKAFENSEFLYAIVNVLLQQKKTGPAYFEWYNRAVEKNVLMTGLYEYTYSSMPANYEKPLAQELVRYFGFHSERIPGNKEALFSNVLTYYKDDSEIIGLYRDILVHVGLDKLKNEQYSYTDVPLFDYIRRLATLGTVSFSDEERNLLARLKELYLVKVSEPEAKNIIVYYPELSRENVFSLEQGQALIPVYTEQAVLTMEDSNGKRFFPLSLFRTRAFYADEFEGKNAPGLRQLIYKIREVDNIFKKDVLRESDLFLITGLIQEKQISAFYRVRLYELLILLQEKDTMGHMDCSEFLLEADYAMLDDVYKEKLLHQLIAHQYYKQSFYLFSQFKNPGLSMEDLTDLAEHVAAISPLENKEALMALCYSLYQKGLDSVPIAKFLNESFEGSSDEMYEMALAIKKKHISCSALIGRAAVESLYVDNMKSADGLMELYYSEPIEDRDLALAYLVLKAHRYLKYDEKPSKTTQTYLKRDAMRLPDAVLLAALKLYSTDLDAIPRDDIPYVERLLQKAAEKGLILPCFSKFDALFELPVEMQGRVYVEYQSDDARTVYAIGQILPQGHFFHRALKEVYPGIYVRSFVLYNREWLQYYFQVINRDGTISEVQAEIGARDNKRIYKNSLYEDVALLEQKVNADDMRETVDFMKQLLLKERMIDDIFKDDK